jgi:hypothetical protein
MMYKSANHKAVFLNLHRYSLVRALAPRAAAGGVRGDGGRRRGGGVDRLRG